MSKLGEKCRCKVALGVLRGRLALAEQRFAENRIRGEKRSYWSGEIAALETAIETLEGH